MGCGASSPATSFPMASTEKLNILLQEDLTIRGGAQLWLMNCGARMKEAGHVVTFLLPAESLLIPDIQAMEGVALETYDAALSRPA